LLIIFSLAIFVSATLLFLIQPMFAKMILPLLGGTPAVWNTCMVFYQAALLAGYLYAHAAPKWLGVRRQAAFHLGLLLLIVLTLPIGISQGWTPRPTVNPIPWLLLLLLVSVGLPFFAISTTAPLLQKWFSHTGHPTAHDPYFLYGASNLGSMLALVGYPLLVEPYLRLKHQVWAWSGGYVVLLALISLCAVMLWRATAAEAGGTEANCIATAAEPLTVGRRVWWVLLAFAPSSLLLGVTTYITTDIAAVPLLWVIPLAIYLLTFVLVFARRPLLSHNLMVLAEPIFILPIIIIFFWGSKAGGWPVLFLHLIAFFLIAMVCHGELMKSRPRASRLTEFYLWMSVGGVLGGIFNALVAPLVFNSVIEYPLIIMVACLLRPALAPEGQKLYGKYLDYLLPLVLFLALGGLTRLIPASVSPLKLLIMMVISCLAGVFCFSFRLHPRRLGLGVGAIMLAGSLFIPSQDQPLFTLRNFFGVLQVTKDANAQFHNLTHGTTLHGTQFLDPARRQEPLTYFHRTGPLGQVFAEFPSGNPGREVAIIGLGTGTIASYAKIGQHYTYYEIDPAVEQLARDERYFTYLANCRGKVDVILGDARLSLKEAPPGYYDLIILDAFSSDAIPIHLVTREALQLYLSKLQERGFMAFNISNRYLDLASIMGNLAQDAGLTCLTQQDDRLSEWEIKDHKSASWWVVIARRPEDLGKLATDPRWHKLSGQPRGTLWTDDFSNILSVFTWNKFPLNESFTALFAATPRDHGTNEPSIE
jgi:hypothetical protein